MRGVKRHVFKSKIKEDVPYLFKQKQILVASDDIAEKGNFQNIQNLETFRKLKSEANMAKYYDRDPFVALYLMQMGPYKNYIHRLASPFTVYTWERYTFDTISSNIEILKDSNFTLHIDASGESVKTLACAHKRILSYKIVIRIRKLKKILPIAEEILSGHSKKEISNYIDYLKSNLKEYGVKFQFKPTKIKRVCTDVSAALYGAVLQSFNNQNMVEYLNTCAKFLNDFELNPKIKPNFVILQWCKCHYIHIMCKDLDARLGRNHVLRPLLKNAFIAAYNFTTIKECQEWFKHIFIVLLTPYKCHNLEKSLKVLTQFLIKEEENKKATRR
ncbi:hypothetical protein CVS40_9073 [Lucilia cuprina]|nr:hypothetical protein CVS40_9073 [Lucilia cuprina]